MTIEQLKKLLRKNKLPVSGKKSVLEKRLKDADIDPRGVKKPIDEVHNIKMDKKGKKLKVGNIIINIHNGLGGQVGHPVIQRMAQQANALPQPLQDHVEQVLEPHIKRASAAVKKFPPVQTVKPISKIAVGDISAKAQKAKDIIAEELKVIKKKPVDPKFMSALEGMFRAKAQEVNA